MAIIGSVNITLHHQSKTHTQDGIGPGSQLTRARFGINGDAHRLRSICAERHRRIEREYKVIGLLDRRELDDLAGGVNQTDRHYDYGLKIEKVGRKSSFCFATILEIIPKTVTV